jgi:hypothetical protein
MPRQHTPRPLARHPHTLEPLETRTLLSALAFAGAYGFGANATGGRGGTVYHVTNLNDSGAGSFRDAVSKSGRIVVFDVGGYVNLLSAVSVKSNLTILGQTAPGDGIGLMGREVSFSNSSNVIVRYLRFRQGDLDPDSKKSGINFNNSTNMILDHVSVQFAQWNNVDAVGCTNITIQNSIIAEPIGQQFNAHTEFVGGNFTWYNDIFADAHNRSPLAKINTQMVNCVVYNYQAGITAGNTSGHFSWDVINNYYITGPSTTSSNNDYYQVPSNIKAYATGNILDANRDGVLNGSADDHVDSATVLTSPFAPSLPTTTAAAAFAYDIANAGASLHRDAVDQQVIANVSSLGAKGQMWSHQTSTGLTNSGYGLLNGGNALHDSDGDGIPDDFEITYGLNPSSAADGAGDFDGTGYTNVEKYANGIADGTYAFAPAGWMNRAIGSPAITPWGGSDDLGGNYILRSSAAAAGTAGDTFTFASQAFTGDAVLTAQVLTQSSDTGDSGIMFRDSADPTAAFASVTTDLKNHVFFNYRTANGGTSAYAFVYASAPVWVRLVRAGNAFSAFYSTDGAAWTQIGSTHTIAMNTTALAGLRQSGASATSLSTATFANFSVTPTSNVAVQDIGAPSLPGQTSFDQATGKWILRSTSGASTLSGENMQLVSQNVSGDAALQAYLVGNDANTAGAGITFRNSLDANSAYAILEADTNNHIFFRYRSADGSTPGYSFAYASAPVWLRLVRSGNTFNAFYSTDNVTWTQVGSTRTLAIGNSAIAGLEVSGTSAIPRGAAAFSNFVIVPAPALAAVTVNDGNPQRSMITSLTVSFGSPVILGTNALTLTRRNIDGTSTSIAFSQSNPTGDGRTFQLTFGGSSLADGVYDLVIHGALASDTYGQTLLGNDQTTTFHRLFGDINNDKIVDGADLGAFATVFGQQSTADGFPWWFDVNSDGIIDGADLGAFATQFGAKLMY